MSAMKQRATQQLSCLVLLFTRSLSKYAFVTCIAQKNHNIHRRSQAGRVVLAFRPGSIASMSTTEVFQFQTRKLHVTPHAICKTLEPNAANLPNMLRDAASDLILHATLSFWPVQLCAILAYRFESQSWVANIAVPSCSSAQFPRRERNASAD